MVPLVRYQGSAWGCPFTVEQTPPIRKKPSAAMTEGLVRNHMAYVSESGLLTIAGKEWTMRGTMAEETADEAVRAFGLKGTVTNGCVIQCVTSIGSDGRCVNMFSMSISYTLSGISHDRNPPSTVCRRTLRHIWRRTIGIKPGQCARWLSRWGNCGHCRRSGRTHNIHVRREHSSHLAIVLTHEVSQVIEAEVR